MSSPDYPSVKIVIAGLVISAIFGRMAWRSHHPAGKLLLFCVTLCFLAPSAVMTAGMNPWLIDARFRSYRLFYWSIQRKMTREEVMAIRDDHYPLGSARLRPIIAEDSASKLVFIMNPENSPSPNRESISLKMEDGRVTGKEYLPE